MCGSTTIVLRLLLTLQIMRCRVCNDEESDEEPDEEMEAAGLVARKKPEPHFLYML